MKTGPLLAIVAVVLAATVACDPGAVDQAGPAITGGPSRAARGRPAPSTPAPSTPDPSSSPGAVSGSDTPSTAPRPNVPGPDPSASPLTTADLRPSLSGETAASPLPPARPTHLRIPAIGVDTALATLELGADGAIEPPDDFDRAGWYRGSVQPGRRGPAVLAGHVDSRAGPAVFVDLVELEPGDRIHVDRADGTRATFRVERTGQYPKPDVPGPEVYGPVPGPELRLVTCGGDFDHDVGHYRDNVVVFASLA